VTVLDLKDRNAPQWFYRPDETVERLAFRADGRRLFALGGQTLLEWDLDRPDVIHLPGLQVRDTLLALQGLSPDGRRFAAISFPEGPLHLTRLKVWDVQTGRECLDRQLAVAYPPPLLAWDPDGRRLALWHNDPAGLSAFRLPAPGEGIAGLWSTVMLPRRYGPRIRIWDTETGQNGPVLRPLYGTGHAPQFSPDGRLLLSVDVLSWRLVDAETGRQTASARAQVYKGTDPVFSPDGRLLAVLESRLEAKGANPPHELRLWDVATGRLLVQRPLPFKAAAAQGLSFRPDGQALVLLIEPDGAERGARGLTVYTWAAGDGWRGQTLLELPHVKKLEEVDAVAYSEDGRSLAVGVGKLAWLYESGTGRLLHTLPGHSGLVCSLYFTPDGKRLFAACSSDSGLRQELKVWDVDTGRELLTLPLHQGFSAQFPTLQGAWPRLSVAGWTPEGVPAVRIFDGTPVPSP
jgi:WD40 repeat protein